MGQKGQNTLFVSIALLFTVSVVIGQQSERRCFQFTWLGPRWNNESVFLNATCDDATRMASGVPCRQPLVVSTDGSWPDIDYIWTHHLPQASCLLADNDVCAQYTYSFNGHVENATYMCTRAADTMGSAITSGCYQQVNGSFATRVCFCRSLPGGVPCNSAWSTHMSLICFVSFLVVLIFTDRSFIITDR